jgi:LysR family hydrogen peroxide-inducible transcriptional activator
VYEHKHFGKAAQQCFVSQPALSMQIQKLEDLLGVQLFERTNKHVMVTAVGEEIVQRARLAVQQIESMKELAQYYQDPLKGKITIGAFPTLAPYIFPDIVPLLLESYPNVQSYLVEEKTDILLDMLGSASIDVALLAAPIENPNFEFFPLFDDAFFLALPPGHELTARESVAVEDLSIRELLLLEDGHCLRQQALEVCSLSGAKEKEGFRATSLETLRQMVLANIGITLIPKVAKRAGDGLHYLSFEGEGLSRSIGMVWRKSAVRADAYRLIAQSISDYFQAKK